jgi:hypothetical protein
MSSLDLSQINLVINLPCIINDNYHSLHQLPILSKAINESGIYRHNIIKGETIDKFLARIYENSEFYSKKDEPFHEYFARKKQGIKYYNMDCWTYAQIVSLVLNGEWSVQSNKDIGGQIIIYNNSELSWIEKVKDVGYIRVIDPGIMTFLNSLRIICKGQWVIMISEDKFLGLSMNGPKIATLFEWINELMVDLKTYSKENIILQKCFEEGYMSEWGFYLQPEMPTIKITI